MKYIFRIIALALTAVTFWGCDDDDDSKQEFAFTGKDNYIVSFAITVDGISYNASITDDRILVKVPYDVSLKDAAASCTLSENATINPDPSTLTDWNEEWQFIVTSGNKGNKVYHYSYQYAEISESGSVVLETQADVDNFKNRRINCIAGNLVIGTDKGEEINNLDGLCNLEKVTNSVIIKNSYKGNDLSGMASLREVGNFKLGTLDQLSTNHTLETISLPALETVTGDFIIRQATVVNIDLPALKNIGETFLIASEGLLALSANELTSIGSNFSLIGTTDESESSNSCSEVFAFPNLQNIGGNMTIRSFPNLASVDCSALQAVDGNIVFKDLALGGILLPKMTACRDIEVRNVPLYTFQAPELPQCGAVTLDNCANLGEIDMSSVTVVDGDLTLNNLGVLDNIEGLSSLTEVHGKLTISTPLKSMEPLANLTAVTGMTITGTNIETLDIRGCTFAGGVLETENNSKLCSFLADDDFDGSVKINPAGSYIQVTEFSMTGFKNISGDFSIDGYVYMESMKLPVESVKGDFTFDCGQAANLNLKYIEIALRECGGSCTVGRFGSAESCSFPNLEKVGKQMELIGMSECMISMPQLRSIGESIGADETAQMSDIYVYNGNMDDGKTLCFPKLEIVNTPLRFRTYKPANCLYENISLPCLKNVNGTLYFTAYASGNTYRNETLKSISVPAIEYVEKVNFSWMLELSEVSTFQKLFQTGIIDNASKWRISNCPKIPTYDDMVNSLQ